MSLGKPDRSEPARDEEAPASEDALRIAELEAEREHMSELLATQFRYIASLEAELSSQLQGHSFTGTGGRRWRSVVGRLGSAFSTAGRRRRAAIVDTTLGRRDPARSLVRRDGPSDAEVVARSGLFDEAFYAGRAEAEAAGLSPLEHYFRHGEVGS